jgi:hypothetical protein
MALQRSFSRAPILRRNYSLGRRLPGTLTRLQRAPLIVRSIRRKPELRTRVARQSPAAGSYI